MSEELKYPSGSIDLFAKVMQKVFYESRNQKNWSIGNQYWKQSIWSNYKRV